MWEWFSKTSTGGKTAGAERRALEIAWRYFAVVGVISEGSTGS